MKFGPVALGDALGAIAAHSLKAGAHVIRKGSVVTAHDIAALEAAGIARLVVARLEPGDIDENEAAARLARALAGAGLRCEEAFTGRVNLFTETAGVLRIESAVIAAVNAIDEGITVATLPAFSAVEAGRMVGTVKLIPYGIAQAQVEAAELAAAGGGMSLAPFQLRRVALVQTLTPGFAAKILDKTTRVTAERLAPMGARISREWRIAHEETTLAAALRQAGALCDLIIVFGASAISDRRDVIPSALEAAGGAIAHLGMPVDPGNLLLLGHIAGKAVIGAPGCARSPKENGFDMVLSRLMAGIPVDSATIAGLGVGGLLMEISSRPQPREGGLAARAPPRLAAVVLAAGRSTRFGTSNKLVADHAGKPVVRHVIEALVAAGLPIVVVIGHQAKAVRDALDGLAVTFVENADYADGMAGSLRCGVGALDPACDGAFIVLGDMPAISADLVRQLAARFSPDEGRTIIAPVFAGKRGHPVLWARRYFDELAAIAGDTGARHLLGAHHEVVDDVPWLDDSILLDVDTPQALAALAGRGQG